MFRAKVGKGGIMKNKWLDFTSMSGISLVSKEDMIPVQIHVLK